MKVARKCMLTLLPLKFYLTFFALRGGGRNFAPPDTLTASAYPGYSWMSRGQGKPTEFNLMVLGATMILKEKGSSKIGII